VEAGKSKIIFGLGDLYLILILAVYLLEPLHRLISFLLKCALGRGPHVLQALEFGSMGSGGGSSVVGQFLHLGLKLSLNLGQPSIFSFQLFKLSSLLAELAILFSELALQLGEPFPRDL